MKPEREPRKVQRSPYVDVTKIEATMAGQPEDKYMKMALEIQGQPMTMLTLERALDIERTIQNQIRFEGHCTVDLALAYAIISHATSTLKIALGSGTYRDHTTIKLINSLGSKRDQAQDVDLKENE
jgi:hypothetical protein